MLASRALSGMVADEQDGLSDEGAEGPLERPPGAIWRETQRPHVRGLDFIDLDGGFHRLGRARAGLRLYRCSRPGYNISTMGAERVLEKNAGCWHACGNPARHSGLRVRVVRFAPPWEELEEGEGR